MNKKVIAGLITTGITGIGTAIAAVMINRGNKKQLEEINIGKENKEDVNRENKEKGQEEDKEENREEKIIIDDSDIEI